MKKTDLAYYAGIMDGEGAIGIVKHITSSCKRGHLFELLVQISSVDEWLIRSLKMAFGGNISHSKGGFAKNEVWRWGIHARQALNFLQLVLPFLKLKRFQAEIAIKFQEAKTIGKYSDEQYVLEEAQRILIHSRSRKGKKLNL